MHTPNAENHRVHAAAIESLLCHAVGYRDHPAYIAVRALRNSEETAADLATLRYALNKVVANTWNGMQRAQANAMLETLRHYG